VASEGTSQTAVFESLKSTLSWQTLEQIVTVFDEFISAAVRPLASIA